MSLEEGTTFKHISSEQKRAAIELFKAGVSRKKIWTQLKMSDRSLRKILSYAKKNPDSPIGTRKPGSGRPTVFTPEIKKKMRNMLRKNPCLSGAQLKGSSVVEPDPDVGSETFLPDPSSQGLGMNLKKIQYRYNSQFLK